MNLVETTFWTDYPVFALGDEPRKQAPWRKVQLLGYDGNKYATVFVEGTTEPIDIKIGYIEVRVAIGGKPIGIWTFDGSRKP